MRCALMKNPYGDNLLSPFSSPFHSISKSTELVAEVLRRFGFGERAHGGALRYRINAGGCSCFGQRGK